MVGQEGNSSEGTEEQTSCNQGEDGDAYELSAQKPDEICASYYEIEVPLAESFHCRICAPIPKRYKRHGDLSKHVRRYHLHRLVFKCRGYDVVIDTLKKCKHHQKSAGCPNAAAPHNTPQPTMPVGQEGAFPVRLSRMPRPGPTPITTVTLDRMRLRNLLSPVSHFLHAYSNSSNLTESPLQQQLKHLPQRH
jgi:hypothetical protein